MSKEDGEIPQVFMDFFKESSILDQLDLLPTPRERMENVSNLLESYYSLGEEDFNSSIKVNERSYCDRAIIAPIDESDIQNIPENIKAAFDDCDLNSSQKVAILLIGVDVMDMSFTMGLSVKKDKDTVYALIAGFKKSVINSSEMDPEQVSLIEEWAGWITGIIDRNRVVS